MFGIKKFNSRERILYKLKLLCKMSYIKVSDIHTVYYRVEGNKNGVPVLFLHGGPGAGCSDLDLECFDLSYYRVILIDQRGSGKSTPMGEIRENTTMDLISDIEKIRDLLNIEKWIIFGGSWGSTLAIAYGNTFPERCLLFILRGMFLGNKWGGDHTLYTMGHFFPDTYKEFVELSQEYNLNGDVLSNYYEMLNNEKWQQQAAEKYMKLNMLCCTMKPNQNLINYIYLDKDWTLTVARLSFHYGKNVFFSQGEDFIQNCAERLKDIPCHIVHGRYDLICPLIGAYKIQERWGEKCKLYVMEETGHSLREPNTFGKIKQIMENIKTT